MKSSEYDENTYRTRYEKKRYQNAATEWLSGFDFDTSVTLTFRWDVSADFARRQLELFNFFLSQKVYGRKAVGAGQRVAMAAFLEEQGFGRLHWHLLISPADSCVKAKGAPKDYVRQCWTRCKGHGRCIDIKHIYDKKNIVRYDAKDMKYNTDTLHVNWLFKKS